MQSNLQCLHCVTLRDTNQKCSHTFDILLTSSNIISLLADQCQLWQQLQLHERNAHGGLKNVCLWCYVLHAQTYVYFVAILHAQDCNELVVKLHAIGELKDELLLPITGMKCENNPYRKVNGWSAKYFRCNTPAYAYPLFKTHKLTPENLLNVDIKEIPVCALQSAGNISTSRITAFLSVQNFAKTARTNFVKTAVSTLETCLCGKSALQKN